MVRSFAISCGIVLTLAMCETLGVGSPLEYPRPCPNGCVPNVGGFGYFKTTWRQWPGEQRQEITNPRAIGAEVLPTPTGQERLPLPHPTTQPQPPFPAPESTLPPSNGTIPKSILPEPPAEPKLDTLPMPSTDGTLPGLPVDPNTLPIPGPFDAGHSPSAPSDAIPPSAPAAKEPPKPAEDVKPKDEPKPISSPIDAGHSPAAPSNAIPPSAPAAKEPPKPTEDAKPKEEPKAKEQPQAKDTTKPAKEPKPTTSRWPDYRQQPNATADLIENLNDPKKPVISIHTDDSVSLRSLRLNSNRADSIATIPAETPARTIEPAAYASVESAGQLEVSDQSAPAVALGGYCPVELIQGGRWLQGDPRWTVVHEGHIYRLSGPTQRQQFLANPEAFAPAYSGNDPVLAVDQHRMVPGQTTYCATYNNRLYTFSNAGTQAQFNQNPQQYAVGK